MIKVPSITEIDLSHKRVVIREDFNVPIVQDRILNDRRVQAALPTIEYALSQNAAVILLSHLGRPTPGDASDAFSLAPVAQHLSQQLNQPVRLVKDWVQGITLQPGEVVLCENVRLQPGEITNDPALSQKIAALSDIFIMDAFAVAHRTEASTVGAIQAAKQVGAGLLFLSELENLMPFEHPQRPFVALMGGSKTTTKLKEIRGWVEYVDALLLGGAMANAFLRVKHHPNCSTLNELDTAILQLMTDYPSKIHLPSDGLIKTIDDLGHTQVTTKPVDAIQPPEALSDIGPLTITQYTQRLKQAATIFWNGPMGIFEDPHFQTGTRMLGQVISKASAFSIAGGGETLTAIDQWQLYPSVISTGGGALLDYLAGKPLPAIQALAARHTSPS